METWKPIPGYEGRYEVSDHGQVRSLLRGGRVLKQTIDKRGRPRVTLIAGDGKATSPRVHTLVLAAWVGPRPPDGEACHYDDDPKNNHIDNLRWGTRSDNALDRVRNGLHNQARKTHCPQGHKYTPENTTIGVEGRRHCRTCQRDYARKRRSKC